MGKSFTCWVQFVLHPLKPHNLCSLKGGSSTLHLALSFRYWQEFFGNNSCHIARNSAHNVLQLLHLPTGKGLIRWISSYSCSNHRSLLRNEGGRTSLVCSSLHAMIREWLHRWLFFLTFWAIWIIFFLGSEMFPGMFRNSSMKRASWNPLGVCLHVDDAIEIALN